MKILRWIGFPVVALALAISARAADKPVTMEGTLVDSKCYLMDSKMTGNDHGTVKNCGTLCLKAGSPGGLLTKDNKFYALLAPSIALAPYVGKQVRVTGEVVNTGSIDVDKIEVNLNGQWKPIKLGNMM
jgi:hypothetical protein